MEGILLRILVQTNVSHAALTLGGKSALQYIPHTPSGRGQLGNEFFPVTTGDASFT
jgi:hypothetical protein